MLYTHTLLRALLLSGCAATIQPVELHMDCMIISGQGFTPDYGSVTWTKIACPPVDTEEEDETETETMPAEGVRL